MPFAQLAKSLGLSAFLLATLALQGCGGGGGGGGNNRDTSTSTYKPLVAIKAEPAGANCAQAGRAVLAGLDADGNGTLSSSEVSSTQYVCNIVNAAPGVSGIGGKLILVTLTAEAAGAHCSVGGTKVSTGIDTDGDGVLGASEVLSSAYVCGGAASASNLMAVAVEPPGSPCANGGSLVVKGFDTNSNGVLDTGEITSTTKVCDATPSSGLSWTSVTTSTAMLSNIGYLAATPTPLTFTLPGSPTVGDMFRVTGTDSGGWSIAQLSGQQILMSALSASSWAAHETSQTWQGIASSSDGSKLVAVVYDISSGQIYTSTDYGESWTARASVHSWFAVASSADGVKLVAAVSMGQIYTSTDSGATWTPHGSSRSWNTLASSADGTRLVATVYGGNIYTSADSGATWTPRASVQSWVSIASSADGMSLAAVAYGGQVYTSADAGVSWTARETNRQWASIASSSDGSKLVAAVQPGLIYTSTDAGATWTPRETARNWINVASSSDGRKLVAAVYGDQLFTSSDAGVTWTPRETARNWTNVASSSDGTKIAAVVNNGQIYTSVAKTTLGVTGSMSGGLDDAVELQYLGSGLFEAVRYVGSLVLN
ncbi:MAG: hypothetical protein QM749_07765 [Aquabacterium sp.]